MVAFRKPPRREVLLVDLTAKGTATYMTLLELCAVIRELRAEQPGEFKLVQASGLLLELVELLDFQPVSRLNEHQ